MPIEIDFLRNKNILRITLTGQPTTENLNTAFTKITTSTEYPPTIDAIWDLRKADVKSADDKLIRHIIELRQKYPQRTQCKSALIASDDLTYGMSRMFQMMSENKLSQEMMVFRDYEEGEKWLLQKSPSMNEAH